MSVPIEPGAFLDAHQRARAGGFRIVSVIAGPPGLGRALWGRWISASAREQVLVPEVNAESAEALGVRRPDAAVQFVPERAEFLRAVEAALKLAEAQPERPLAVISDFAPIEAAITDETGDPAVQKAIVGGLVPLLDQIAARVEQIGPKEPLPAGYRSRHEYVLHTLIQHNREIRVSFDANRKIHGASRRVYEVDLWCEPLRLAIEVDGAQHFAAKHKQRDEQRDADLAQAGIKTQRILASAVMADPTKAVKLVAQTVEERRKELSQ
jgi:very-short-patch-repair endonuclease